MAFKTREEWLIAAAELMAPWLKDLKVELPEMRISCGWAKRSGKAIGWCYHTDTAKDLVGQIFISPELEDPLTVLATELHELIHLSDDGQSKHSGHFKRVALAVGLEGQMRATVAGPALLVRLGEVAAQLGPYPHSRLEHKTKVGTQTTRQLKISCKMCGYTARTTRRWLDVGLPTCPCGQLLEADVHEVPPGEAA